MKSSIKCSNDKRMPPCSEEHALYLKKLRRKKHFVHFMQFAILIVFIAVRELL